MRFVHPKTIPAESKYQLGDNIDNSQITGFLGQGVCADVYLAKLETEEIVWKIFRNLPPELNLKINDQSRLEVSLSITDCLEIPLPELKENLSFPELKILIQNKINQLPGISERDWVINYLDQLDVWGEIDSFREFDFRQSTGQILNRLIDELQPIFTESDPLEKQNFKNYCQTILTKTLNYYQEKGLSTNADKIRITAKVIKTIYRSYSWFEDDEETGALILKSFVSDKLDLEGGIKNKIRRYQLTNLSDLNNQLSDFDDFVKNPDSVQVLKVEDSKLADVFPSEMFQDCLDGSNGVSTEIYSIIQEDLSQKLARIKKQETYYQSTFAEIEAGLALTSAPEYLRFWTKLAVGKIISITDQEGSFLACQKKQLINLLNFEDNPYFEKQENKQIKLLDPAFAYQIWDNLQGLMCKGWGYLDNFKLDNLAILPLLKNEFWHKFLDSLSSNDRDYYEKLYQNKNPLERYHWFISLWHKFFDNKRQVKPQFSEWLKNILAIDDLSGLDARNLPSKYVNHLVVLMEMGGVITSQQDIKGLLKYNVSVDLLGTLPLQILNQAGYFKEMIGGISILETQTVRSRLLLLLELLSDNFGISSTQDISGDSFNGVKKLVEVAYSKWGKLATDKDLFHDQLQLIGDLCSGEISNYSHPDIIPFLESFNIEVQKGDFIRPLQAGIYVSDPQLVDRVIKQIFGYQFPKSILKKSENILEDSGLSDREVIDNIHKPAVLRIADSLTDPSQELFLRMSVLLKGTITPENVMVIKKIFISTGIITLLQGKTKNYYRINKLAINQVLSSIKNQINENLYKKFVQLLDNPEFLKIVMGSNINQLRGRIQGTNDKIGLKQLQYQGEKWVTESCRAKYSENAEWQLLRISNLSEDSAIIEALGKMKEMTLSSKKKIFEEIEKQELLLTDPNLTFSQLHGYLTGIQLDFKSLPSKLASYAEDKQAWRDYFSMIREKNGKFCEKQGVNIFQYGDPPRDWRQVFVKTILREQYLKLVEDQSNIGSEINSEREDVTNKTSSVPEWYDVERLKRWQKSLAKVDRQYIQGEILEDWRYKSLSSEQVRGIGYRIRKLTNQIDISDCSSLIRLIEDNLGRWGRSKTILRVLERLRQSEVGMDYLKVMLKIRLIKEIVN